MPIIMNSEDVALEYRPDYWRQCLSDNFNADYAVAPKPDSSMAIHCSLYAFGPAQIAEVRGSPMELRGRFDPGEKRVNLILQLTGECTIHQGGKDVLLQAGSHGLFRVTEEAKFEIHGAFHHLCLILPESHLAHFSPRWETALNTAMATGTDAGGLLVDYLRSLLARAAALEGPDAGAIADSTSSLLGALLEPQFDRNRQTASRLEDYHRERILVFVRKHLRNPVLDIGFIASGVGLSRRYVHRLFAQQPHTLMQWVWAERLRQAARQLRNPTERSLSIGTVAYTWGFNSQAHFSHSFRKCFGTSPGEYRRAAAPGESHSGTPALLNNK